MGVWLRRSSVVLGAALLIYWATLFVLTHIHLPDAAGVALGRNHTDKLVHFVAYACLAFLLVLVLAARGWLTVRTAWLAVALVVGYGVVDEVLQLFVGRSCELADLAADTCGALTGVWSGVWLLGFSVPAEVVPDPREYARTLKRDLPP